MARTERWSCEMRPGRWIDLLRSLGLAPERGGERERTASIALRPDLPDRDRLS